MKPRATLVLSLGSRLAEVDAACLALRSFLASHEHTANAFLVELSARECLNNAILHGNRAQPGKKVHFHARVGPRWLRLQVTDQGPGFAWRRRGPLPDPEANGGRGLAIIHLHADRVAHNRPGNQITLWFPRPSKAPWHRP